MTTVENRPAESARDDILALLRHADPAVLVNCLTDITGDPKIIDRYEADFEPLAVRSAQCSHRVDPMVAEELCQRMADVLPGCQGEPTVARDTQLFRRMAAFSVGEPVDEEFVPLLLEQAGFETSDHARAAAPTPPQDFHVVVIGAGMVGINAGVKLGQAGFRYTIVERRSELGGTWSVNTYPGAAVDTPSHYYSFSFEPNPDWTHYYPFGPDYLEYLQRVAEKHRVTDNIRYRTSVTGCRWDPQTNQWVIATESGGIAGEMRASAVVTAVGFLNRPAVPDIPGRSDFTGTVMHSAEWDHSVDLTGKRVVVLGTGCTAVQIVAAVAEQVRSLTVVQRQPHWISPVKNVSDAVPESIRWLMAHVPFYQHWYRLKTYWYASDNLYPVPRIDPDWPTDRVSVSAANDKVMRACLEHLEHTLGDRPDLLAKLIPDFPPFAKRIVKDPGYLEALRRDHVELLTGTIERFQPGGVTVAGGVEVECDVVILATGFHLDFLSTMHITGRDGLHLNDAWDSGLDPRAYLGVAVPGFPNFFTTAGPNSAPNHGGGHNLTSEEQVHYIVECLRLLVERKAATMEPTEEATEAYNARVDVEMDRTVWKHGGTAHGYYRNQAGRAVVACPWRMVDYWTSLRRPDPGHFRMSERED